MRFSIPYNVVRLLGIATLFLIGYIVVIGIFGQVDVSPLLPEKLAASIQEAWPKLPFFRTDTDLDGKGEHITYYTVPTRIFTSQELAQMRKAEAAKRKATLAKESTPVTAKSSLAP